MPIYTLRGCTIEVPKGGRSARATRHGERPETKEFAVITDPGAPTPEVQAQWWVMGKPAFVPTKPPVVTPELPKPKDKK